MHVHLGCRDESPHPKKQPPPRPRRDQLTTVVEMRRTRDADVDWCGTESIAAAAATAAPLVGGTAAEEAAERYRFCVLVAAMISSQTRDPVTHGAVARLEAATASCGGLFPASLLVALEESELANLLKVGTENIREGAGALCRFVSLSLRLCAPSHAKPHAYALTEEKTASREIRPTRK